MPPLPEPDYRYALMLSFCAACMGVCGLLTINYLSNLEAWFTIGVTLFLVSLSIASLLWEML